ncbi:MAG TPA: hypothetical protein VMV95_01655 [Bacillota bacterium]|nr:hypothetical protein [Bacillota bacterium]
MSSDKLNINAVIILEIIGRPPEHLVESLKELIEGIEKEKGVVVKSKQIKEPIVMKEQKDFYTTFAEVEIEVEEILYLAVLMFKYMPAHIEIISPEILALSNNGFNEILNELVRRLHGYDEIARIMQVEKQILLNKIQELGGDLNELFPQAQIPQQPEEIKKKSAKKSKKKSKPKKKSKK